MNKTLATFALAALPALLLSACNGNGASGVSGLTPSSGAPAAVHHRGRFGPNDNGPQDLHAGGADPPFYAYTLGNQPVGTYDQAQSPPAQGSLFYAAPTQGTIYYCETSSGDGRKAFYGSGDSGFPPTGPCAPLGSSPTGFGGRQDPLDFTVSNVALTSTEYGLYKSVREPATGTSWGEPFEWPQMGNSIVYPFRPQDFKAQTKVIKLSTWTYCAIANGTISDWNDPAITADNGKSVTGGNSETIIFYFRADSAGLTYNYTYHLNTKCNAAWQKPFNAPPYESPSHTAAWAFGVNQTWPGPGSSADPNPNFIGETGEPGILAAIQSTPWATGYLSGSTVKPANPKVSQAWLQSGFKKKKPWFVDPLSKKALTKTFGSLTSADITYGEGSDEQPLGTSTPWCILYIDPSKYASTPAGSYPIVLLNFALFYGQNNGVHVSDKISLIKFLNSTTANKIASKLEYGVVSTNLHNAVLKALNGQGSSQPACLQ